ncbi:MAG TPA: TIGR00266 family protein [Gemmatimonadaceae bacterium]|jgi:uncharacterized protein (TIGR00266 family)|nr:TIGR00266 family protein [Gemmatimonadaceae bacterium]
MSDAIDYKLIGGDLQAVIITLDPGEMVQAEAGSMMFMHDGIVMNTTLDPNAQGGGMLGRLFQGAKRALSGDSFFVTTFANAANVRQEVAFSSHFPGKILPVDLADWNGVIIGQKDAFLCAARGINVTVAFTRRIGAGFFGGEGFILQRIEGQGLAFLHACGMLHEIELAAGQSLRVDTGCLVAMDETVDYDIQMVPGIKTALFGGEGLFFAALRGPGRVLLQTLPFSRLADRIIAASPLARSGRQQSTVGGGIIGGVIGSMVDNG